MIVPVPAVLVLLVLAAAAFWVVGQPHARSRPRRTGVGEAATVRDFRGPANRLRARVVPATAGAGG